MVDAAYFLRIKKYLHIQYITVILNAIILISVNCLCLPPWDLFGVGYDDDTSFEIKCCRPQLVSQLITFDITYFVSPHLSCFLFPPSLLQNPPRQVNEWSKNDERLLAAVEHGEAEKVASLLTKKGASAVKLDSEGKSA